jgi:hypothetical protein
MRMPPERNNHYLRHNKGGSIPRDCFFFDTEAYRRKAEGKPDVEEQRFMLGVACHLRNRPGDTLRESWLEFYKPIDFWTWVTDKAERGKTTWLFAHNLKYDLTMLGFWGLLESGAFEIMAPGKLKAILAGKPMKWVKGWEGCMVLKDPPTFIIGRLAGKKVVLCDTFNYFHDSLDELAAWVDLEKVPLPDPDAPLADYLKRCGRDVQICRDVVLKLTQFWRDNDLGHWRYTAPGLAMHAFRHRFMKHPILIDNCEEAAELGREALAGGECRNFWAGRVVAPGSQEAGGLFGGLEVKNKVRAGPVYHLDKTSFYPSVMRDGLFPCKLLSWQESASLDHLQNLLQRYAVIARVHVESEVNTYPVKIHGERHWARGSFWTTLAGPELALALAAGDLRQLGRHAVYARAPIFRAFADWILAGRAAATCKAERGFYKLLGNSLAGKFGQLEADYLPAGEVSQVIPWGPVPRIINGILGKRAWKAVAGYLFKPGDERETKDSFPAIEAYVNSLGRVDMHHERAHLADDQILYQDTDSLHVTASGFVHLDEAGRIAEGEPGKLELRGTYDTAEYRGLKDWTGGGIHHVAGRKASAEQKRKGHYEQWEFASLNKILSVRPSGAIEVKLVKVRHGRYHPRGVFRPAGSVEPVRVEMGLIVDPPPDRQYWLDPRERAMRKRKQAGR